MSRVDKKNKDKMATTNPSTEENPSDSDSDFHEEPGLTSEADAEDEEFEFDPALFLKGIELVDLTPDFVRPEGFLMVPRLNKRTGEVFPPTTTFAGILNDVIPWKDNRGKERVWFSCTATAAVPGTRFTGRKDNNEPFEDDVKKGDRIGISGSGAINALKSKKGHFVLLHWTGNKVPTKNGEMWEVKAKVSKEPVEKPPF